MINLIIITILVFVAGCTEKSRLPMSNFSSCSHKVMNGKIASAKEIPSVVMIVFKSPQENTAGLCSGAVIAKTPGKSSRTVLTAAHCVGGKPFDNNPYGTVFVFNSNREKANVVKIEFAKSHIRGDYSTTDLALLQLDRDFSDASVIASQKPLVGSKMIVTGYGSDGVPTKEEKDGTSGIKRVGITTIDMILLPYERVGKLYNNHNFGIIVSSKKQEFSSICPGDSGSPAFNEKQEIIAISTAGNSKSCQQATKTAFLDLNSDVNGEGKNLLKEQILESIDENTYMTNQEKKASDCGPNLSPKP